MDEAYKNDIKVQNGEMSEREKSAIEKTCNDAWKEKTMKVISLFDEYVKNYWKVDSSSKDNYEKEMKKHSDIAKEGFDALKEIFDENTCVLETCFSRYLATCEFLSKAKENKAYDVLKETADFSMDLDEVIRNNPEAVKAQLGDIKVNESLSVAAIKKAFVEKYEEDYKSYKTYAEKGFVITQNDDLTIEEKDAQLTELAKDNKEVVDKMKVILKQYYNIVYKSLLTDKFKVIRNTEHNRWYMDKTYFGVVPRDLKKVRYLYGKNKSKDTLRHLCMTTNEELETLAERCIDKIAEAGFYIMNDPDKNKPSIKTYNFIPSSLNELKFNAINSKKSDPLLYSIFNTKRYFNCYVYLLLLSRS